jgi:hypothetical protein
VRKMSAAPVAIYAASFVAVSMAHAETLLFPDAHAIEDWWYTDETKDGSLMLSTKSNDPGHVPFYLLCKGHSYSMLFQPPAPPEKDSSGQLIYRYTIRVDDYPNSAMRWPTFSANDHQGHADPVQLTGDSIAWLLRARWSIMIDYVSADGNATKEGTYIRLPSGAVVPKHECQTKPCVDCTFLDYETCYEQADKLGLINKNVGFGPGQRPPVRIDRKEEPLEAECSRQWSNNTTSYYSPGKGEIVCPVPGAVAVEAPQNLKSTSHYIPPPVSASSLFLNRCVNQGYSHEPPPLPP